MEAHAYLSKKNFCVSSFGSGDKVKLPGAAANRPNVYEFGTSYDVIYKDLLGKDRHLYTQNGLLHMLDRNRRIKTSPQRLQDCEQRFDVLVSCEERVYDQIVEMFDTRGPVDNTPVHLINMDIQDNHEEATIGAFLICDLCTQLEEAGDLDNDIDELLQEFEIRAKRQILHSVQFY